MPAEPSNIPQTIHHHTSLFSMTTTFSLINFLINYLDADDSSIKSTTTTDSTINMPNIVSSTESRMAIPESAADFKDWLEGIKMVARLPGGMPVEFRRKVISLTQLFKCFHDSV